MLTIGLCSICIHKRHLAMLNHTVAVMNVEKTSPSFRFPKKSCVLFAGTGQRGAGLNMRQYSMVEKLDQKFQNNNILPIYEDQSSTLFLT